MGTMNLKDKYKIVRSRRYIDADETLGAKMKRFLLAHPIPFTLALGALLTLSVQKAVDKIKNKISGKFASGRYLREIERGRYTEERIVKEFVKQFLSELYSHADMGDPDTRRTVSAFQQQMRNVRSFDELRQYIDDPRIYQLERAYWNANNALTKINIGAGGVGELYQDSSIDSYIEKRVLKELKNYAGR